MTVVIVLAAVVPAAVVPAAAAPASVEAVNGLELSLEVRPARWSPDTEIEFLCTVKNVSEKPIRVAAWGLDLAQVLEITDAAGNVLKHDGGRDVTRRMPPDAFPTIAADAEQRFTLTGRLTAKKTLVVNELLGGVWHWPLADGDYTVRAVFDRPPNDEWMQRQARGGYWTGRALSAPVKVTVGARVVPGGEPVDGLKLSLNAAKTELRKLPDGKVEPTQLTLTFTNVSDKPVKLNTYDLTWSLMRFEVTGPDGKRVSPDRSGPMVERMMAAPTAKHYPTLAPGETWEEKHMPKFPGWHANVTWALDVPGEYRLKVVYTCSARHLNLGGGLAKGCWTGNVSSGELTLVVAPKAEPVAEPVAGQPKPLADEPDAAAGKPVNNLTLALSAEKTELAARPLPPDRRGRKRYGIETTSLVFKFTNAGETPIRLNLYDIPWRHFWAKVTGPGVERHMVARAMVWVEPEPKDFATIAPGKSHEVRVQFPGGIGETNYVLNSPGTYRITVGYRNDDGDNRVSRLAKGCWTGNLSSGEVTLKVVAKP